MNKGAYTLVSILVDIIVVTIAFIVSIKAYVEVLVTYRYILTDVNHFIDLVMAVNFVRDEIKSRIVREGFEASSTTMLSYCGYSNKRVKLITYYIRNNGKEWRMYRKAAGEGNNLIWKSKKPIYFEIRGNLIAWYLEDLVFYIWEPDNLENLGILPGTFRRNIPEYAYTAPCE